MSGNLNGFRSSGRSPDSRPSGLPEPRPALAALLTFPAARASNRMTMAGMLDATWVAAGVNPAAPEQTSKGFRSSGRSPDSRPSGLQEPRPALAALLTFPASRASNRMTMAGTLDATWVAAGVNPAAPEQTSKGFRSSGRSPDSRPSDL